MNQENKPIFNIGDSVFLLNARTNQIDRKDIERIRTEQSRKGLKVFYSLLKDDAIEDFLQLEPVGADKSNYFWISEGKVFKTKEMLIERLAV